MRLFFWQVISGSKLAALAKMQYQSEQKISAVRGNILTKDNSWLTASVDAWLVFAQPKEMKDDAEIVAARLAPVFLNDPNDPIKLKDEFERLKELLAKKDLVWVPLKQKIGSEQKKKIEDLKITGIGFDRKETRYYPESSAAAQLLGFVGKDKDGEDIGYFGLEGYYDLPLSGKPGFVSRESDALGSPLLFGKSKEIAAVEGVDLVTSIDKTIQLSVEQKLKKGIETYGAKSGTIVIISPKDGAILAMASYPSYDPAKYFTYEYELFKNPAISDAFEPGSIMKPLIMAAGLDSKVIEPDTKCDICYQAYKVDKYFIETWDKKYYPNSTMTDVLVHSDNVGMTFVGLKLGTKRLVDYLDKYGFGHLTGIDLQGEANPPSRDKNNWNIVDSATATFGQGIAVTPIQMARAMSIIANGGYLVTPHVVDEVKKDGWSEIMKMPPPVKVLSDEAARETKEMMIAAVKNGEAKWAVPKGFKIAGKTGTAQIAIGGHYDAEKTIASFIGFAPADDPKFLMLVILREPTTSQWGSETAAPLWFSIARDIFPYLKIQPENQ